MAILDNAIILSLIVGAFIAGMKIADKYHRQALEEQRYALQKQYSRLMTGSDADDPVQPYVSPESDDYQLPDEFSDRLQSNRRATIKIAKSDIAAN